MEGRKAGCCCIGCPGAISSAWNVSRMAVSSTGGARGISIVSVTFRGVSDDSTPGKGAGVAAGPPLTAKSQQVGMMPDIQRDALRGTTNQKPAGAQATNKGLRER